MTYSFLSIGFSQSMIFLVISLAIGRICTSSLFGSSKSIAHITSNQMILGNDSTIRCYSLNPKITENSKRNSSKTSKDHLQINPLFKSLQQEGWSIGNVTKIQLPQPVLKDSFNKMEQQKAMEELIKEQYSLEDWLQESVVAPFILQIGEIKSDQNNKTDPYRTVNLFFVVHVPESQERDEKWMQSFFGENQEEIKSKSFTAEELTKRKIKIDETNQKNESYGHTQIQLLDKVEVQMSGHSFLSRTAQSIVVASQTDPRFDQDKEYPNQWCPLEKLETGFKRGSNHAYTGGAFYLKATRLALASDAWMIEAHLVYAEPIGWFEGANLLRSKLPPIAQKMVRSLRREIHKKKSPR